MTDTIEKIYADPFTLDGRLKPNGHVTKAKVAKFKELFEKGYNGDKIAAATLAQTITTSDAIYSGAYLTNIQVLPQFDRAPRTWSTVAGIRALPDFKPAVLRGVFGEWEGLKRDSTDTGYDNPAGIAPVVAENSRYPYATLGDVEAAYGRLKKRGFKVGWTWEARINDDINFFGDIPGEMLRVALDTEEWEVWSALIDGTAAGSQLIGGTTYTGATVPANSTISRDAVVQAIFELSQRTVNGRKIQVNGGYNLIVPVGTGDAVRYLLNRDILALQDGSLTLSASFLADGVSATTIVESPYVTGTNWYLLPKPGAVSRPVLELGRLRGYEAPELRVDDLAGNYSGAAAVSPFEGSFDNDTIDMRLRYPLTGILWDDVYVVWSQGDNVA